VDDDVEIRLSTTSAAPDGLSTTFAENVGADDTTVFDRGRLILSQDFGGIYIPVTLARPFLYEPTAGNLLLDVRLYSLGRTPYFPPPAFDAEWTLGDSVSGVFSTNVNSPTASGMDTVGLVTRFTVEPVPEPSIWALAAVAVPVLVIYGWMRRRLRESVALSVFSCEAAIVEGNVISLDRSTPIWKQTVGIVRSFLNSTPAGESLPLYDYTLHEETPSEEIKIHDTLEEATLMGLI
jgi:hypothetical protein